MNRKVVIIAGGLLLATIVVFALLADNGDKT
jgi:hypothetical protein